MKTYSRVYAKIDLDAIAYNFASMRSRIAPGCRMAAVVKADGYGHGAAPIARLAENYDYIWGFAVATAEEALALRSAGIQKPILILGYVFPEHYRELIASDVRMTVFQQKTAEQISSEAKRQKRTAYLHLAVDTGMTRIGFPDTDAGFAAIRGLAELSNIRIEGMFTHFARADEAQKEAANGQLARFLHFADRLSAAGISTGILHASNSAGIIDMPYANLQMVRAGISIYGIYPSDEVQKTSVPLKPAMELKSHISYIKDVEAGVPVSYGGTFVTPGKMRIATVPVGYADGYPRLLSGRGRILVRGKSAPIVGRICMDQFMADVTDILQAREADEVTLLGSDGQESITVEELSGICGRFPYEFVCGISKRVPRVYQKDGRVSEQKDFFDVY